MKKVYHATQLPLFILQKQCSKCPENGLQDASNFPKDRHSRDGFCSTCNACLKKYYQENKEKIKERVRTYRLVNKERIQAYARSYRERKGDKIRAYKRRYQQINAGNIRIRKRIYRKQTASHRYDYNKAYVSQNRAHVQEVLHRRYLNKREGILQRAAAYQRVNAERIRVYKRTYHMLNRDKRLAHRQKRRARRRAGGSFTAQEWRDLKARSNHTCLCCKKSEPEIKLTPDHVIPLSHQGRNTIDNIQPLCLLCNLKKGVKTIDYRHMWAEQFFKEAS